MADVSVRPAQTGDVDEIARIQVETWRIGYDNLVPPAVLEALSVDTARAAWHPAVTEPPTPRHHVFVAFEQQWCVGFCAVVPGDDVDADEAGDTDPATTVVLGPLLVEPRWGRRGHGSRLLAAAIDTARAEGMTRATTWIPEGDVASREFFVSAGWAPDGLARALDTGDGELREIRLHTAL